MTPAPDPDCLFCKIASGDIPATIIHSTDKIVVLRDISPQAPTHFLAVPRAHYPNIRALAEADHDLTAELLATATQVAETEGLDRGFRVVFNTGPDASQSVEHVHAHLLGGRQLTWPPG